MHVMMVEVKTSTTTSEPQPEPEHIKIHDNAPKCKLKIKQTGRRVRKEKKRNLRQNKISTKHATNLTTQLLPHRKTFLAKVAATHLHFSQWDDCTFFLLFASTHPGGETHSHLTKRKCGHRLLVGHRGRRGPMTFSKTMANQSGLSMILVSRLSGVNLALDGRPSRTNDMY